MCAPRSGDEPKLKQALSSAAMCAPRSGDEPELPSGGYQGPMCAPRSGDEPVTITHLDNVYTVRPAQRG